jgi:leucyl/phenylalanyl-tRNA--protein transferase
MNVNGGRHGDEPIEPPRSTFTFPPNAEPDERGVVTVGGDLAPGTLLTAYRAGLFPMRLSSGDLAWWSPDPRGVLTPDALVVSRSLRRSLRRFEITVDTCFETVIAACAERAEGEYDWITPEVRSAFIELHRLGWAHSVEAWAESDGSRQLVGGLYGVTIGGLFSGESMFHRRPDASKAALVALVGLLRDDGSRGDGRLIDVQWLTPHLASLGAVAIPRHQYLERLARATRLELPRAFARSR